MVNEFPETSAQSASSTLRLVAVDHRTAPSTLRERLRLDAAKREALTARLRVVEGCEEVFILSTCLRTEVLTAGGAPSLAALAAVAGVPGAEIGGMANVIEGPEAVAERLFRVASGLESIALGETQILGQIKAAYQEAVERRSTGPVLSQLIERALAAGRTVRSETSLARGIVSIPSLAAHIAVQVLGGVEQRRVVLLGTGKMASLAARHFRDANARLTVVSRRGVERAREVAADFEAEVLEFDSSLSFLRSAEAVVCATDAAEPLLTARGLGRLLAERGGQPLLVIDLCLPRAAEPAIEALEGCRLFNLDSMQIECEHGRRRRAEATAEAEPLIRSAVSDFASWWNARQLKPVIQALFERLEALRRAEIERVIGRGAGATPEVEALSRALMAKIANGAISRMRRGAETGDAGTAVALIHDIFQLDAKIPAARSRS